MHLCSCVVFVALVIEFYWKSLYHDCFSSFAVHCLDLLTLSISLSLSAKLPHTLCIFFELCFLSHSTFNTHFPLSVKNFGIQLVWSSEMFLVCQLPSLLLLSYISLLWQEWHFIAPVFTALSGLLGTKPSALLSLVSTTLSKRTPAEPVVKKSETDLEKGEWQMQNVFCVFAWSHCF